MEQLLLTYKAEVESELIAILDYWMRYTIDEKQGGFYGRLDNDNSIREDAPKGSVLNSRILWTFSAAYNATKATKYLEVASRAFRYFIDHFIDKEFGGVYWTADHTGKPLDTKKQIYALSFAVYGLSEYYRASGAEEAKGHAIDLYHTIVRYSHDKANGGFIEALSRDWKELVDLRLSEKDANERKSMNTHLHILEGFANLYRVWPDAALGKHIKELIRLFLDHIIHPANNHLSLFFDDNWQSKSGTISYGHDIEAAWLLQEAAEIIGDNELIDALKIHSVGLAEATLEGLDSDGGLWYEYEPSTGHLIKEKHSWPQAEAMVGFFNAWQITNEESWLQRSLGSWRFIQQYIINKEKGEWYWGIEEGYDVMPGKDKVGIWKCPYHSCRACIEIMSRVDVAVSAKELTH